MAGRQPPSRGEGMKRKAFSLQQYEDYLTEKQLLESWSLLEIAVRCGINTKWPSFHLDLSVCGGGEGCHIAQVIPDSGRKATRSEGAG